MAAGWRPKFEFHKDIAWDMFHFGKYIFGGSVLFFLNNNLDNLIVGKYLGVEMLGYYAIAFNLATFISTYFLGKVGMVMYPAYSKIQDNKGDVIRVMLKSVRMISVIIFPFAIGLCVFAPDILGVVLGPKWLPAANVLRVLAWVGLVNSIGTALWPIFMARGNTKADFLVRLVSTVVFFILIVPFALKFKIVGAGMAVLIASLCSFAIGLWRIQGILEMNILRVFQAMMPAFLCSMVMVIAGLLVKYTVFPDGGKYGSAFVGGIAVFIYIGASYVFDNNLFVEIKRTFSMGSS